MRTGPILPVHTEASESAIHEWSLLRPNTSDCPGRNYDGCPLWPVIAQNMFLKTSHDCRRIFWFLIAGPSPCVRRFSQQGHAILEIISVRVHVAQAFSVGQSASQVLSTTCRLCSWFSVVGILKFRDRFRAIWSAYLIASTCLELSGASDNWGSHWSSGAGRPYPDRIAHRLPAGAGTCLGRF